MAFDTQAQRLAAIGMGDPWGSPGFTATSAITNDEVADTMGSFGVSSSAVGGGLDLWSYSPFGLRNRRSRAAVLA